MSIRGVINRISRAGSGSGGAGEGGRGRSVWTAPGLDYMADFATIQSCTSISPALTLTLTLDFRLT